MVIDRERLGVDACAYQAHRNLVGIVCARPRAPGNGQLWVASGTLLRAGDHPLVLTARHNVEHSEETEALALFTIELDTLGGKLEPSTLVVPGPGAPRRAVLMRPHALMGPLLPRFVAAVHPAPEDLDVALVEVAPEHKNLALREV